MGTLLLTSFGCGQQDAANEAPIYERARELQSDLTTGAHGPEARTVNDYLTLYGYFPNNEIARDYPSWRPVVATAPAAPDLFDDRTAEALRRYQSDSGLTPTGVADAPTRALMALPRCGLPEGTANIDPSDKFARNGVVNFKTCINSGMIGRLNFTWKLVESTVPGNLAAHGDSAVKVATDAITRAWNTWQGQTSIAPTQIAGTPGSPNADVQFQWGAASPVGSCCASTLGRTVTFFIGPNIVWKDDGSGTDIETFAAHEIGHAIGLHHSAFSPTRMFPSMGTDRRIFTDDEVGMSSFYDTYVQKPGAAKDIGVGPDGLPWVIGTSPIGNDFPIFKFNGSGWNQTSEFGAAVRIAVSSSGAPWVVNSGGAIFRRTNCVDWNSTSSSPFSGCFMQVNGAAKDVGAGGDGSVWVIGAGAGDQPAFRFTGDRNNPWSQSSGTGVRISVGIDGKAWIVKNDGSIWRHTIADAPGGTWEQMQGRVADIGIGLIGAGTPGVSSGTTGGLAANGYVWSVATASSQHISLAVFDEQPGVNNCDVSSNILSVKGWVTGNQFSDLGLSGPADAVAVGPNGEPWVINPAGGIFTSVR